MRTHHWLGAVFCCEKANLSDHRQHHKSFASLSFTSETKRFDQLNRISWILICWKLSGMIKDDQNAARGCCDSAQVFCQFFIYRRTINYDCATANIRKSFPLTRSIYETFTRGHLRKAYAPQAASREESLGTA